MLTLTVKASLKGQGFGGVVSTAPSTSESSPSFRATLESHPGSPRALMQHGILKQAVYIKRSAGAGGEEWVGGGNCDCIQQQESKHTGKPLCSPPTHPTCTLVQCKGTRGPRAHLNTNINTRDLRQQRSRKALGRVCKYQRSTGSPLKG